MSDLHELGELMYLVFQRTYHAGKTPGPIPTWADLHETTRQAWRAAIEAAFGDPDSPPRVWHWSPEERKAGMIDLVQRISTGAAFLLPVGPVLRAALALVPPDVLTGTDMGKGLRTCERAWLIGEIAQMLRPEVAELPPLEMLRTSARRAVLSAAVEVHLAWLHRPVWDRPWDPATLRDRFPEVAPRQDPEVETLRGQVVTVERAYRRWLVAPGHTYPAALDALEEIRNALGIVPEEPEVTR